MQWTKINPNGKDVEMHVPTGVYTISVDSDFAGGACYLWIPGQVDGDDYFACTDSFEDLKAFAEEHYRMCLTE